MGYFGKQSRPRFFPAFHHAGPASFAKINTIFLQGLKYIIIWKFLPVTLLNGTRGSKTVYKTFLLIWGNRGTNNNN